MCCVGFYGMAHPVFLLPLWAEEEGDEAEKAPMVMDEIVVTATKTEEKRKDIPNAVIVKDAANIQESPARSVGELLANEPGVDWRTYGDYGGAAQEIHIRGMNGKGTQVLVNGMTINSPSLGTADVGRIPMNNIARIEVVKGSGSVLYGSGAVGGVMNIITKRPERDVIDASARAGYGSQDTFMASAEHGMFAFNDLGYYLTAAHLKTNGFRDNSDLNHHDASLNLVLEKGSGLNVSLYGDWIDRDYGMPGPKPPGGTQDYSISGVPFYNSSAASLINEGSDEDYHAVLNAESQVVQWLTLRFKSDYTHTENYFLERYNSTGTGAKTWVTNEVMGIWGAFEIKPFEQGKLFVGAEYKDTDWKRENIDLRADGTEDSGSRSDARHGLDTTGSFVEVQYRPSRFFKALVGLRHEDHSTFGTEDLPRFGLTVNPAETTALKMTHGKQFLAPTPNDLFWPQTLYTKGNENLSPETGWHSDVTLEQSRFDDRLFVTGSAFQWDLDDRIQWVMDPATWVYSPTNLKSYEARGFELGTKVGPVKDMTLSLDYTYLDAEEEAQEYGRDVATSQKSWKTRRAIYSPEHQFKADFTYANSMGITASAVVRYVSDRLWYRDESAGMGTYKTVAYTLDSYWTVDVKLQKHLFDHWIVSGQANNLFDAEYDSYLATFYSEAVPYPVASYPGAGQSFFFSLTYEY
jgi:iron complex outermembrane receptor protein